jgi:hypothetical protein
MNFIEAYKALVKDKKVRQSDWVKGEYIEKNESCGDEDCCNCNSSFREEDGTSYELCGEDYLANDWELYEEECKLHTFEEALTYFKEGKYIRRKIHNDYLLFHKDGNCEFGAIDVMGNDWIIIDK